MLTFHFSKMWEGLQIWDVSFAIKSESVTNDVCNVCVMCVCTVRGWWVGEWSRRRELVTCTFVCFIRL